jgi:hypothetical protein
MNKNGSTCAVAAAAAQLVRKSRSPYSQNEKTFAAQVPSIGPAKNEIVQKQKQLETYFAIVQPRAVPTPIPTRSGVSGWGCYPL